MEKLEALEKQGFSGTIVEHKIGFESFQQVRSIGTGIDLRYYFDKKRWLQY